MRVRAAHRLSSDYKDAYLQVETDYSVTETLGMPPAGYLSRARAAHRVSCCMGVDVDDDDGPVILVVVHGYISPEIAME